MEFVIVDTPWLSLVWRIVGDGSPTANIHSGTRGIGLRAMKNAVYIGETGWTAVRFDG